MRYTDRSPHPEAGEATSYGLYNAQDRGALHRSSDPRL